MRTSICLLIFFFTSLFAKEGIEGPWTSTLELSSMKLTLNLEVEEDGTALFECIEQGLTQKVEDLSSQDK